MRVSVFGKGDVDARAFFVGSDEGDGIVFFLFEGGVFESCRGVGLHFEGESFYFEFLCDEVSEFP